MHPGCKTSQPVPIQEATSARRGSVPGLAGRIKFARELRGWSQEDLAAECNEVGGRADRREVSRWELGSSTPSALSLLALSRALAVTTDWLLAG